MSNSQKDTSLSSFIGKNKTNRKYLFLALAAALVQFIIFKWLYPYPDFTQQSHFYIYAASAHLNVNIYPIGYSKFLLAFHSLTPSALALILFQYLFLMVSALYLFFTLTKFYELSGITRNVLFYFLFFNPLFLYLANYISNDSLFISLSLIWFTQLLWVINRPKWQQLFTQAILVLLCIAVTNIAWYYPIIGAIAFGFSSQQRGVKWAGISLPILLVISFLFYSSNANFKITGTRQYPVSLGWQLANNALYMFEYTDTVKFISNQNRELDKLAKRFYAQSPKDFYDQLGDYAGDYFILESQSPLNKYSAKHHKSTSDSAFIIDFAKASSTFAEYGSYQIKHNPAAYFWEYILPNVKRYFLLPIGDIRVYNQSQGKIDSLTQSWFALKIDKITAVSNKLQGILLSVFPTIFLLLNLYWMGTAIWLVFGRKLAQINTQPKIMLTITTILLLLNFLSSIVTATTTFRNQAFVLLIGFPFSLILLELMDKQKIRGNDTVKILRDINSNTEFKESAMTNR